MPSAPCWTRHTAWVVLPRLDWLAPACLEPDALATSLSGTRQTPALLASWPRPATATGRKSAAICVFRPAGRNRTAQTPAGTHRRPGIAAVTTLLILWAGQTGHTHALAAAAADAARLAAPAVSVRLLPARSRLDWTTCWPPMASCSPHRKTSATWPAPSRIFSTVPFIRRKAASKAAPMPLLVSAGNDGRGAAGSMERIVRGYALTPIAPPLIVRGIPAAADLAAAAGLGPASPAGWNWACSEPPDYGRI